MITTTLQPPAPRGPNPLVPLALAGGLLAGMMIFGPPPAQASTIIGFRISLLAWLGAECREAPLPETFFPALYACQIKAENLALLAELREPASLGLPAGEWRFKGRCLPVLGNREA